jgi:hypothetical protein
MLVLSNTFQLLDRLRDVSEVLFFRLKEEFSWSRLDFLMAKLSRLGREDILPSSLLAWECVGDVWSSNLLRDVGRDFFMNTQLNLNLMFKDRFSLPIPTQHHS